MQSISLLDAEGGVGVKGRYRLDVEIFIMS